MRGSAEALEHKWAQVRGDVQQLQARTRDLGRCRSPTLAQNYLERSMRFDREVSKLRSLDAWQLRASAGVVPLNGDVDWYGMAELSVNLGVFMRAHEERVYLDARHAELVQARYEADVQLNDFREQARAALAQARQELVLVDRELKLINDSRLALERSEAPGVAHTRDTLALHAFSLESDRAFLMAWSSPYPPSWRIVMGSSTSAVHDVVVPKTLASVAPIPVAAPPRSTVRTRLFAAATLLAIVAAFGAVAQTGYRALRDSFVARQSCRPTATWCCRTSSS